MTNCKRHIIATCMGLMLPLGLAWSEAIVVDDSDQFAMIDEQAYNAPASRQASKYDDSFDTEEALAREDNSNNYGAPSKEVKNSAALIDKIQGLQREIQELRGQLEVQAHDLKLLQQQQLSFYKDLDGRLGSGSKVTQNKPAAPVAIAPKPAPVPTPVPAAKPKVTQQVTAQVPQTVARGNPADEQISYLAAYELVKNQKYDEALNGMQVFVQKYPRGGYTANAQYWLGELYLLKKDYANSIAHFETVLNQFPSSSKSADSLLKSGYAFAASGNTQEARLRFQKVLKTYPNTPMAQMAQLKLDTLNAS